MESRMEVYQRLVNSGSTADEAWEEVNSIPFADDYPLFNEEVATRRKVLNPYGYPKSYDETCKIV